MFLDLDEMYNKTMYIHCDTEEKAKECIEALYEAGAKWNMSSRNQTNWKYYGKNTTYCLEGNSQGSYNIIYSNTKQHDGDNIIKFEDIEFEEIPEEEIIPTDILSEEDRKILLFKLITN